MDMLRRVAEMLPIGEIQHLLADATESQGQRSLENHINRYACRTRAGPSTGRRSKLP
jgi:hypothetical protein